MQIIIPCIFRLMKIDIYPEIIFSTARSGGKGGQNVNKVETMVEGRWRVDKSALVSDEQKQLIRQKLANKITDERFLLVKSQVERSQLGNKQLVVKKMAHLIEQALVKKKSRIATRPSAVAKYNRLEGKKINANKKENRKKVGPNHY